MKKLQQLWQRLLGRLRYGLLIQELLDRLARAQVFIYPYYVVLEPGGAESPAAADHRCTFRLLGAADVDQVMRVLVGRITKEIFLEQLTRAECLGVFYDGKLAGYTWVRLDMVAIPEGLGQPVFVLHPDEAYLFDMYVALPYRGLQLAGILQQAMQAELMRRGRTRFSLTLTFNRSSRRFKAAGRT